MLFFKFFLQNPRFSNFFLKEVTKLIFFHLKLSKNAFWGQKLAFFGLNSQKGLSGGQNLHFSWFFLKKGPFFSKIFKKPGKTCIFSKKKEKKRPLVAKTWTKSILIDFSQFVLKKRHLVVKIWTKAPSGGKKLHFFKKKTPSGGKKVN